LCALKVVASGIDDIIVQTVPNILSRFFAFSNVYEIMHSVVEEETAGGVASNCLSGQGGGLPAAEKEDYGLAI
jgi:hypothetical protein